MKAFNKVNIGKLFGGSYTHESGFYQLLNFKKMGITAGYKNTRSNAKLDKISFGFE